MLQRGDYAREICYFVVVHATSPFPFQPVCIIYFSFPAHLLYPNDIAFFFYYRVVHNVVFNGCMCMYVKYTL